MSFSSLLSLKSFRPEARTKAWGSASPLALLALLACATFSCSSSEDAAQEHTPGSKENPYPGQNYSPRDLHWTETVRHPDFVTGIDARLADPKGGTSPASFDWRIDDYRSVLSAHLHPVRPWPEHWQFAKLCAELMGPVPIEHPPIYDAFLDFYYLVTDGYWSVDEETGAQIMEHIDFWEQRFQEGHPYWLAVMDVKAGVLATLSKHEKALELFSWIDKRIDPGEEAKRNPIFMNGYYMTRANVMRWFGQDVQVRSALEQAEVWRKKHPVPTKFGRTMDLFGKERLLDILRDLEQTKRGLKLSKEFLSIGKDDLPVDYYINFRRSFAHFLLDDILIRKELQVEFKEESDAIENILQELNGYLQDPEAVKWLAIAYRMDELDIFYSLGQSIYSIEWWLNGPQQALRSIHETRVVEWLLNGQEHRDAWFRSDAKVYGNWATLTAEAQAPILEQRQALDRVRPLIRELISSLKKVREFSDGYDPNHRSGLRNLVEALLVHALEGKTGTVTKEEVVHWILQQGTVGSVAKRMQAKGGTLQEVQERLCAPGTGILHFQPGYRNHYWILIDQSGVTFHKIGAPHAYRQRQSQLFGASQLAQVTEEERRLENDLTVFSEFVFGSNLLAEIRARGWDTLLTSGLAGHYYVPFDLLRTDRNEPIGSEFRISHLPSMTVGLEMHRRSEAFVDQEVPRFLSVIAPDVSIPSEGQSQMLGSNIARPITMKPSELSSLFQYLHADWDARALIGPGEATLERVTNALENPPHLLHILGHGFNASDLMSTPGILLHSSSAETGLLTHKRLLNQRAPWLAILTACSTTDVEPRSGDDGGHHLAGTLLAQGANTVICSALPVEFNESSALDQALFREISAGHSAAEALFQARQALGGADGSNGLYLVHAYGLGNGHMPKGIPGQGNPIQLPDQEPRFPYWLLGAAAISVIALIAGLVMRQSRLAT